MKKLEEGDGTDDEYILHVSNYYLCYFLKNYR
jgi:hypothetical protein